MKMVLIVLASFFLSTAFAQDQQRDGEAVAALMKITKYLADADLRCMSVDDCKLLPIGSRACGGPSGYVITSKMNGNMSELEYLATQTEVKQAAYNRTYGIQSICSLIVPPELKCLSNYCR